MTKPSATIPTSEPSTTWKGEEWVHFEDAAEAYANFVEVSTGVAQRLLREQCASGNIRSIRYDYDGDDMRPGPEAVLLKPSEWIENPYIDFQADYEPIDFEDPGNEDLGPPQYPYHYIDVSQDDVVYWIIQAKPKLSLPPTARQGKLPRIKAMLAKLYPVAFPILPFAPARNCKGGC